MREGLNSQRLGLFGLTGGAEALWSRGHDPHPDPGSSPAAIAGVRNDKAPPDLATEEGLSAPRSDRCRSRPSEMPQVV